MAQLLIILIVRVAQLALYVCHVTLLHLFIRLEFSLCINDLLLFACEIRSRNVLQCDLSSHKVAPARINIR